MQPSIVVSQTPIWIIWAVAIHHLFCEVSRQTLGVGLNLLCEMRYTMMYSITGPQKLDRIRHFFEKNPATPTTILDIGGNADSFEFIHSLFPDAEVHTLNNYRGHLKGVQKSHHFDAEKEKIPFEDGSVSMIFLMDIVEHLIEPTRVLEECQRVLAKGGLLIITTPNLANVFNRIFLLFGWTFSNYHSNQYKKGNPFLKIHPGKLWEENLHKSVFTLGEMKSILADVYHLNVVHVKGFSYVTPHAKGSDSSYGGIRSHVNGILPTSFQEGMVLIARK